MPRYSSNATKRWTRRRLFAAAEKARCHIVTDFHGGLVTINHNGARVFVFPDGSCIRGDVPLNLATRMTYRDAARALGIDKD